jgi:hypothetical protein
MLFCFVMFVFVFVFEARNSFQSHLKTQFLPHRKRVVSPVNFLRGGGGRGIIASV